MNRMDDLISRQEALKGFAEHSDGWCYINALPPAEPERKQGEWITDDLSGIIQCDRCRNDAPMETTGGGQYKSKFCPYCGAEMKGGIQ